MTLANLGISKADFEDSAFEDLARELTWTPRTKNSLKHHWKSIV